MNWRGISLPGICSFAFVYTFGWLACQVNLVEVTVTHNSRVALPTETHAPLLSECRISNGWLADWLLYHERPYAQSRRQIKSNLIHLSLPYLVCDQRAARKCKRPKRKAKTIK